MIIDLPAGKMRMWDGEKWVDVDLPSHNRTNISHFQQRMFDLEFENAAQYRMLRDVFTAGAISDFIENERLAAKAREAVQR